MRGIREPPQFEKHIRADRQRQLISRFDCQRALTARQRLVKTPQLKERVRSIADRRHEARIDHDRAVVIGKRFVKTHQVEQRIAAILQRFGEIGTEGERAAVSDDCFLGAAESEQHVCAVIGGLDVIRVERERLTIMGDRFVEATAALQRLSHRGVQVGDLIVEPDRGAKSFDRRLVTAFLQQHEAGQMQRDDVIWIDGQDLPAGFADPARPPGMIMPNSFRHESVKPKLLLRGADRRATPRQRPALLSIHHTPAPRRGAWYANNVRAMGKRPQACRKIG